MKKSKEILICILTIVMLIFTATNVFALEEGGEDVHLDEPGEENDPAENLFENLDEDPVNNENENDIGEQPGGKDQPVKNNVNEMPNTGIEDAPIIAIVVCVVAATIGYTQIIKYNKY